MYICMYGAEPHLHNYCFLLCKIHCHCSHSLVLTTWLSCDCLATHSLNDIHMHWNSICQLLSETLENLTQVYIKLCTINDITTGEIDWLFELEEMASQRQVTRGNLELIQNEITRHKVSVVCALTLHHLLIFPCTSVENCILLDINIRSYTPYLLYRPLTHTNSYDHSLFVVQTTYPY